MNLLLQRKIFTSNSTIGTLSINGKFFCHTLEDTVRPGDVKIYGKTAIPAGNYKVLLTMSNRFKKILPELCDVPGFKGVRIHGGNTPTDTLGCILVAHKVIDNCTIQGSASDELVKMLTLHLYITIDIVNLQEGKTK